ncbi:acylphosphatase [Arthrobacter sp. Br18]|uniref:acylphosphatase n=1 Tax=Arthrobacter sp. Br18 TaxID=1312954 RepID=UPI0004B5EC0B|nr:acylphosphatase [Arthrobacter sp. Br18]
MAAETQRLTATIMGEVQAVGFRYWARGQAEELGLTGSATNNADGSVALVAEGLTSGLNELLRRIRSGDSPGRVDHVDATVEEASGGCAGFECL